MVIGLIRLAIKPKSIAPEAYALTTRPSELLGHKVLINNINKLNRMEREKVTLRYAM